MRRTSWRKNESPQSIPPVANKRVVPPCPLSPQWRLAAFYLLLVTIHTGLFVYWYGGGIWAVVISAPAGFVLGWLLYFFGRGVTLVRERLLAVMQPLLAGFLLFFIFLVGYILVFSVVVSLPVEWSIMLHTGSSQLARQYVLYAINLILVMAILSWLRWLLQVIGVYRRQWK